jgi:hypothetical protein
MNFFVLLFIFAVFWYAFYDDEKHEMNDDVEFRVNEIKNMKRDLISSSDSRETTGFIEKFLNEKFKDQVEILIQLKNARK